MMTYIATRLPTENGVLEARSSDSNSRRRPRCEVIWSLEIGTMTVRAVMFMVTLKRHRTCFGSGLSAAWATSTANNSAYPEA